MAKKQYAVIGMGRFGSSVAKSLTDMGFEVLAIDSRGR
jgi:trk system potassium uptake protein TrkA